MIHAANAIHRHRYNLMIVAALASMFFALFSGVLAFCAVRCGDLQFWDGEMHHAVPAAYIFPTDQRTAADISVKMREGRLRAGQEIPSDKVASRTAAGAIPYEAEIRKEIARREAEASGYFWLFLCFGGVSLAIFAIRKVSPLRVSHGGQRRSGTDIPGIAAEPHSPGQLACRTLGELSGRGGSEAFKPAAVPSYALPFPDQSAHVYPHDGMALRPSNTVSVLSPERR